MTEGGTGIDRSSSGDGLRSLLQYRLTRRWQWFAFAWTVGFMPALVLAVSLYLATGYWQFAYLALLGNLALPVVMQWLSGRDHFGPLRWG